jgi:fructose-bisphosphate aldolase class I
MAKVDGIAEIARSLVAPGKGILAADESGTTIERRFAAVDVEPTEENRLAYREILLTTDGAGQWISGVILFDETIRQRSADGTSLPEVLERQGIIPGIKVDQGAKPLALAAGEKVTEGLDGLRERLTEYRELGARFAKWRAVIAIGADMPSKYCIWVNAHALARFAALAQEAGLVPIVEPEVLMDGGHRIERSYAVTSRVQHAVFTELRDQRVMFEHMLLKPNMVLSGYDCPRKASIDEVAAATIKCLRHNVPAAVPGIVFLSGGQSAELATAHLNAMNQLGDQPWQLSFSFGRALQAPALRTWRGVSDNVTAAQSEYLRRARLNGAARSGAYTPELERLKGD